MIRRLIKLVFGLAILGVGAFLAYAYLGPIFFADDFAPPSEPLRLPVTLEVPVE